MKRSGPNQAAKCPPPWLKKALKPPSPRTTEKNTTLNENSVSQDSRTAKTYSDSELNEQILEFAMLCYLLGYADGIHFKKESSWPNWFSSALRNPPFQSGLSCLQRQNEQKKVRFAYDTPAWLQYAMRNQQPPRSSASTGRADGIAGCSGDDGSVYSLPGAASRSLGSSSEQIPDWFLRALKY